VGETEVQTTVLVSVITSSVRKNTSKRTQMSEQIEDSPVTFPYIVTDLEKLMLMSTRTELSRRQCFRKLQTLN